MVERPTLLRMTANTVEAKTDHMSGRLIGHDADDRTAHQANAEFS